MARWRLRTPHYLNVPGNEWEYKEIDQSTGRQARKVFAVPMFCDTDTIIAHDGKGQPRDTIFLGPPTPDMEPLDVEAEAISKEFSPKWDKPIEGVNGVDYSQSLIAAFERQMTQIVTGQQSAPNTSVSRKEFEALQSQMAAILADNVKLKGKAA